jgi:lipoate-protein ligase B
MRHALLLRLGRVPYEPALRLQRALHALRRAGRVPDLLLALEHEPVVTLGRAGNNADLLLSPAELRKQGVEVYAVERGGAATYHGPGQLVLYPIVHLRELELSLREYVGRLEEVLIRTGKEFGVELFRRPGHPGAWHARGKVGFIGIHVHRWVTLHGLAMNVDLKPNGFAWIVPCGLKDVPVASLSELSAAPCPLVEVERVAIEAFSEVFGMETVEISGEEVRPWLSRNG